MDEPILFHGTKINSMNSIGLNQPKFDTFKWINSVDQLQSQVLFLFPTIVILPVPPPSAHITLWMRQHHYYYSNMTRQNHHKSVVLVTLPVVLKTIISVTGLWWIPLFSYLKFDAKSSEMWFWSPSLPVVLVTIISLGCDESPYFIYNVWNHHKSVVLVTLPVVLVTIISLGCDESPVSSSFPLSSFSHLLLVQTHHQIVRSVITISFPMHQHRRCHNPQKLHENRLS